MFLLSTRKSYANSTIKHKTELLKLHKNTNVKSNHLYSAESCARLKAHSLLTIVIVQYSANYCTISTTIRHSIVSEIGHHVSFFRAMELKLAMN